MNPPLSKREFFAGQAMASLILQYNSRLDPPETMPGEVVAQMSIWHADALIAELERTEPKCEHGECDCCHCWWLRNQPASEFP